MVLLTIERLLLSLLAELVEKAPFLRVRAPGPPAPPLLASGILDLVPFITLGPRAAGIFCRLRLRGASEKIA